MIIILNLRLKYINFDLIIMSSNPSILKYCKDSLSKQFERLHCFVKNMLLITLLIYSINLVSNNMEVYFSNIPKQTVNSLKLWTLFSSCLVNTQFINLIFAFIVWVPNAIRLESSNGTIKYFINFLTNNAIIQFFFIITCYILSFESVFIISEKSFGLWPIIMSEITMICIANPENNVYLWFIPYELKAKFYPYLIYLILIVSNGFNLILLDVAIGIVFGHLYMFKLKPYLNVRDNVILRTEKACYLITLLPGR